MLNLTITSRSQTKIDKERRGGIFKINLNIKIIVIFIVYFYYNFAISKYVILTETHNEKLSQPIPLTFLTT